MKFYQLNDCDVFINLSLIAEIDKAVNEVTMADGSRWMLSDHDINEILKEIKKL